MCQYHPWRRLRELAHVTLNWHATGPKGWCQHATQEVSLRLGLTQAERRSVICHEVIHLERGPAIRGYVERDELEVRRESANRLIRFDALVNALLWSRDEHELAEELWVDVRTVRDRLRWLTDVEASELNRRLDEAELQIP